MPSAAGQDAHWRPSGLRGRTGRIVLASIGGAVALVCLGIAAVLVLGLSGFGTERLRSEAERAIETAAGFQVAASIGPARITLDGTRFLAVELVDIGVRNSVTDAAMLDAGTMRFGIRLLPLLTGRVLLGSAKIADARFDVGSIPFAGRSDWTRVLRNERGLIDPDRLAPLVFTQVAAAMNMVAQGSARGLELENVKLVIPEGTHSRTVTIRSGMLAETGPGTLSIAADADMDGRSITLAGTALRDQVSGRITSLELNVTGGAVAAGQDARPEESVSQLGGFSVAIVGHDGVGSDPAVLKIDANLQDSVLDLGARGAFTGNMDVALTIRAGSGKVEIDRLRLQTGRTSLDFNGAVGPRPATVSGDERPVYRYELISTKTVIAPEGSPEPALDFGMRVAGTYDQASRLLLADQIVIKSGPGEALGTARVEMVEGKAPGIALALDVDGMQVSHVKQLWPWFAGPKARLWVFDHVFGGIVDGSRIEMRVQPGRLGNGVPLSGEEVSARFQLQGIRFDTAGLIPPVRDADGVVEVRGNDIDVAMSSGTVYLPSGRQVVASNATLAVRGANVPPVIGKLEMDVAGEAAAITELASYEPINAMRHLGMLPEDLSGEVSGHVTADIPFQKTTDLKTLDWLVELKFDGLAVAKPFDGQRVTEAVGTISVQPDRAVINAVGKLNGMPADIALVEPLRPGGPARQRSVKLILNDQARDLIAPGLAGLVTGPVKVELATREGGGREITADLTEARLNLPWAGWSKGAGVKASASFTSTTSGTTTTLSDFSISGATFSASGDISLADGKLSSARLGDVRLNRGDDVSVNLKRVGKGYSIDIKGKALDARPLIKMITGAGEKGENGNRSSDSGGSSVALRLDVASVGGFNGQSFSGVKLSYDGTGSALGGLTVSAATGSGGKVSVTSGGGSGKRSLELASGDAGAVLAFLDLYKHVEGGTIKLALAGSANGRMSGQIDSRDFWVVDEPKLASIVTSTPPGDNRSLTQAVRKDIDTSRVKFERGFAQIEKGPGSLSITNGVLRGPLIGTTFQGILYDAQGRMDMTGTFMPAYGLNRIFGELPLVGVILGNGRDRGLIGVTYKLEGDAKSPRLQINPLSVMAPGIFRSIFEFQ